MKRTYIILFFPILVGCYFFMGGCREESHPILPTDCRCSEVSFKKQIVPIITSNCSDGSFGSCHQIGSENEFLTYQQFKAKVDEGHVQEHCIERREMPPPYSLGPKRLADSCVCLLKCWIDNGAPDN